MSHFSDQEFLDTTHLGGGQNDRTGKVMSKRGPLSLHFICIRKPEDIHLVSKLKGCNIVRTMLTMSLVQHSIIQRDSLQKLHEYMRSTSLITRTSTYSMINSQTHISYHHSSINPIIKLAVLDILISKDKYCSPCLLTQVWVTSLLR